MNGVVRHLAIVALVFAVGTVILVSASVGSLVARAFMLGSSWGLVLAVFVVWGYIATRATEPEPIAAAHTTGDTSIMFAPDESITVGKPLSVIAPMIQVGLQHRLLIEFFHDDDAIFINPLQVHYLRRGNLAHAPEPEPAAEPEGALA